MILGNALLCAALIATVSACILFHLSHPKISGTRADTFLRTARFLALSATAFVAGAAVYLAYLIWTHQFQVAYVAEYSARRSEARFLFAAFWGGQEGSILLWLFWTAVLGAVLAFRGGRRESRVWPIYGCVQTFLLLLVLLKSPFVLGQGPVPQDGRGLNPLLENYWMVIHPPILFLGASSLAVPFAWTLYALIYRDWEGWVKRAFPWTLFSFASLGFGLSLGGYWAYETLGWGGFWGWDPVENASLVPWLFVTALLHGISIQRANRGYTVSNLFLGTLPFAWMAWGTFLTRTGLLGDFSVHSFSSLGDDGYWLLLCGVLLAFFLPLTILILRFKEIPKSPAYERVATREFGFFLASALLGVIGLITAVGMSAPIITKLWLAQGAAAQPEFYNRAIYPPAILMAIGMSAAPYFAWRATDTTAVMRRLFPAYAASIFLTVVMFLLGARQPWMLLLFAAGVFALLTNVVLVLPRLKRREGRRSVGGFIAHMGAACTLIGVASLVAFTRTERVALLKNQPTAALGYKLTYLGMTSQPFDRANLLKIRVVKGAHTWIATPRLYSAPWGGKDQLFTNPPAIERHAWGDLYIAHFKGPFSMKADSPNNGMEMTAMDERSFGDYKFKFWGLDFEDRVREAMKKNGPQALQDMGDMHVKALVDVTYKGKKVSVAPEMEMGASGAYSHPVVIPGEPGTILSLEEPRFPKGAILSTTNVPDAGELVQLDVSSKPLIWMVWLGTLLYTFGGLVAYRRRAAEMVPTDAEPDEEIRAPVSERLSRRERRRIAREPRPEPARAAASPNHP